MSLVPLFIEYNEGFEFKYELRLEVVDLKETVTLSGLILISRVDDDVPLLREVG
jgi:hypothetical protein